MSTNFAHDTLSILHELNCVLLTAPHIQSSNLSHMIHTVQIYVIKQTSPKKITHDTYSTNLCYKANVTEATKTDTYKGIKKKKSAHDTQNIIDKGARYKDTIDYIGYRGFCRIVMHSFIYVSNIIINSVSLNFIINLNMS